MDYHKKRYVLLAVWLLLAGWPLAAQDVLTTGLEQLSALEGYIQTAEKGYRIATDGLHLIGDTKHGEADLHRLFFRSLRTVDEAVSDDPLLAVAYGEAAATDRMMDQGVRTYGASVWMTANEKSYLGGVDALVEAAVRRNLQELGAVTRDSALSMMDGERLAHISGLAAEIHERYVRVRDYLTGVGWLVLQREKERAYTETLKRWYGVQ